MDWHIDSAYVNTKLEEKKKRIVRATALLATI